ncbi:phenylacetate--CoA ligase family protein [Rhodococcus sp. OK302]|uniref:phenylacetate--CoA ligase family protein n=1 Tax=Rhodococcus sp. OK302 TaxID=1882769 RepID=UPI000B9403A4|nr:AMP-binding protein [Rhodococcus sp. OK302]OYD67181.1 phenylacetate-CoA ligase [Rhodococcus sp. OK302]
MAPERAYWNEKLETRPRAERELEILALLQQQLRRVYTELPFYRRHYDAHGFHPDQVRSLDDFTRLVPVITKQMLRDDQAANPPFGSYLGVAESEIARVHGSSGTTGAPTLYGISHADWEHVTDVMAQGFFTTGVRSTDRVQLATVFGMFIGGWGALQGCERIGATTFPIGAGETERQLELMYRVGSTVLISTPTYALHMLERARSLGYDTAASPLRLGIFIGEPGAAIPGIRDTLEQGWGMSVRDLATTSEMTPFATNAECEHGLGVHVLQDQVWTEIVDKENPNQAAPDSVSGGVVYTHLRRESQPMIRFASRDESHMTYEPCPCGRTYPRLPLGVYGRLDDMLIIRGANVYPSQVQRSLLSVPGTGVEFVVTLDRDGTLDTATVQVEYDPTLELDDVPAFKADLAVTVRARLKNDTNINFVVEILEPETLERAVSKANRVIDRRPSLVAATA